MRSSLGDCWTAGGDPGTGVTVRTGRTVHPGDRVVFTCDGQDPLGGELLWWLHPFNRPRGHPIIGETVRLVWQVDEASIGERAYLGIGMAGLSISHRAGGPSTAGYDGWLVFYYRVHPPGSPPAMHGCPTPFDHPAASRAVVRSTTLVAMESDSNPEGSALSVPGDARSGGNSRRCRCQVAVEPPSRCSSS